MSLPPQAEETAEQVILEEQARALLDINRPKDALPLLLKALAFEPDDAFLLDLIAHTHSLLGSHDETLEWANKALVQEPENAVIYRTRARALSAIGKNKEALRAAQEAHELDPDEPEAYQLLTFMYQKLHRLEEAEMTALKLRSLAPDDYETYYTLARIAPIRARLAGRRKAPYVWEESEGYARAALRIAPDSDEMMCALGHILMKQKKHTEALTMFYAAAKQNPTDKFIVNSLNQSIYRFFFSNFAKFIGLLGVGFEFEISIYLQGLSPWFALILATVVSPVFVFVMVSQFYMPLLNVQDGFRKLPNEMQNTLRQIAISQRKYLGRRSAVTAAIWAIVPSLILVLIWH